MTLCLSPFWPAPPQSQPTALALAGWVLGEAAVGLGAGLAVSLFLDGFLLAAQVLGLQAGYSYASTIDPTSEADAGILQVWMQLATGFLFFAVGMDRHIIRALASSFQGATHAPAAATATDAVTHLGTNMFSLAVRVAFPIVIVLLLVDLALAMAGRIQAQLQLLSLAFPLKMLTGIVLLAATVTALPKVFENAAVYTIRLLPALAGH
jgi:flagellar biosynthetic protein FliR